MTEKLVTMPCSQAEYDALKEAKDMCARCGVLPPYRDYEWCLSCRPELKEDGLKGVPEMCGICLSSEISGVARINGELSYICGDCLTGIAGRSMDTADDTEDDDE